MRALTLLLIASIPGAGALITVATDNGGTGYITDRTSNRVYSYDNLASRNGTIAPDRTLQGAATLLNDPWSLVILE